MSFDDWMLALHVLSAFAWVAGMILFWVLIVAVRRTDTAEGTIRMEPIVKVGNASIGIGMGGTIALGLWLAFSVGCYDICDGWIITAIVLWVISAPTRISTQPGRETARSDQYPSRRALASPLAKARALAPVTRPPTMIIAPNTCRKSGKPQLSGRTAARTLMRPASRSCR